MRYAKVFKTKREALTSGRNALRKLKVVSGIRGGKIRSSKAKVLVLRTIGGYVPIAKRKIF